MRRAPVLILAVVLALLGAVPPASAVDNGSYGIRLLDAPTERRDDPRARLYVVDHVQAGASLTRRFEVSNATARRVTMQLYPAAASVAGGSFTIAPGRATNELTEWTTVTPSSVDLAPGGAAVATVSVKVPTGVEDGERYAAVLAEAPPAAQGGPVQLASRVGIRMYLDVGSGKEPASDFVVESLQAERTADGSPLVTAQVRNTGGRALDMSGDLKLTKGPGGLRAGPFDAKLGTTLGVGQKAPVTVPLDKAVPDGPWLATLTLKSGRLTRAATATITFPKEAGVKAQVITAKELPLAEDPSIVIPVAGGLLGLVVLLLLLVLYRRRRRDDRPEQPVAAG